MATEERAFCIDPELSDLITGMSAEDLLAFRELQEQSWNASQIEVGIFSLVVLGGKLPSMDESRGAMDQAYMRAESWAAEPEVEGEEYARRMRILDNVLAMKLQLE